MIATLLSALLLVHPSHATVCDPAAQLEHSRLMSQYHEKYEDCLQDKLRAEEDVNHQLLLMFGELKRKKLSVDEAYKRADEFSVKRLKIVNAYSDCTKKVQQFIHEKISPMELKNPGCYK